MTNKSAGPIDDVKKLRQANGHSKASLHVSQALSKLTSYYADAVHLRSFVRRCPRVFGQTLNRCLLYTPDAADYLRSIIPALHRSIITNMLLH